MKSKFPDENSDGVVSSRFSVVDHILYFKHLWSDHWAAVSSGAGTDLNIVAAAGAVVKAHQCVLLPLSPQLCHLLQPALSCESPWNLPTVILPDRTKDDVTRLLQLIYTGSCVITNGDMYLGLVRLMHDVGLYIPGERLSFKPVTRTLTFSAQQEAQSEAGSKHSLKGSSLEERIDQQTSFLRGLPPEGLNSPASSIRSQANFPGVDKFPDFDGGNDAIDLSKKAEECEILSQQFSPGAVENYGKETSFKSLVSDQFENQNDEIRTTNESKCNKEMVECDPAPVGNCTCAHCGLKFRTNTPVMYVLMHERSCKQQLLQSSEDFTVSGDPQTNVRDYQPDRLPSRHSDSTESTDSNENIFSEGIFHNENNVLESSNIIENGDVEMENNDLNCRYEGKDSSKIEIKDGNENNSLDYNTPKIDNMIEVVEIEDTNENDLCMAQNVPESGNNIEYIATDDSDLNLITEIINLEQNIPKGIDIKPVEKEESGKALKTSYNCYICDEELEQLNASVYHHYATVHFSEELLRDFGERVDDDKCLDCGTVVNGLKDQYWFLVHMGVKHRRVEKYLPPQFHLGPSEKGYPTHEENVVIGEKSFVLVPEDENDEMNENWAQNTSCPVCLFSMERFKIGDKSDHLYGHFKDKIKDWFAGMRYVYAFPSTTCPQCKKVFENEHCLYKHLGSAHNLYQTFIQRSKIEVEKNEESILVLNDAEMEVEKKEEIGCKTDSDNVSKNRSKPKVSAKTFFPETKEANNGSKYVNRKLSLNAVNKECCLCSKQFSNYHRLRYHYSLVHFRKELESEMYPLFENNNGSCPIKSCPKVFKRFKFFMYHMGSIHRQVDKYVETATTEDAKNQQGSKKNQPYCQAKYKNCPKCDKRSRSYNCVKHMVTHYYNQIETQLKPNESTCVECGESYENLDDLIYHAAESHKALNQFCSQEELKFIDADKDMEMPPNFCKTEKAMVTINFKKKTQDIVEKKKTPGDIKVLKSSKIMDVSRKQMKTRSNPSKCRICKKQTKNNGTLLQHLCGHFRQELKQEFSNVLCRPELEVTCPKCDIDIPKTSFITHIGAMHKEVVKYAPWLQSKKDQTLIKYKHEKIGKEADDESYSSRKRLVLLEERGPDTEAQNRNIPVQERAKNSEVKRNQNTDDDNTEPPLITVNPSKANVSAVWIDSDIEVLEPPAESSTSSMMASSSSSSGLSSSATTSLIPVSPLLDPRVYYGTMEEAKKAFRDKNKK